MGEYSPLSLCGNCVYCYVDILWESTIHCHFVGIVSTVMLTYCGRVLSTVTLRNCVYCYVDILWESTIHCLFVGIVSTVMLTYCGRVLSNVSLWELCLLLC